MRGYQCYEYDTAEMHNVSQSTSQTNFIIRPLLSSEMVLNVRFDIEKTEIVLNVFKMDTK